MKPLSKLLTLYISIAITLFSFASTAHAARDVPRVSVSWNALTSLAGKYPDDNQPKKILIPQIRKLLGSKFKEFNSYYRTQVPIKITNGFLLSAGMAPHDSTHGSYVVISQDGEILVAIRRIGEYQYVGAKQLLNNPTVSKFVNDYN